MDKKRFPTSKRVKKVVYVLSILLVLGTSILLPPKMTPSFTFCLFRNTTGLPCPSCGMGRGFIQMGKLQIKKAFEFNIMSPIVYLSAILVLIFLVNDLIFDKDTISRYLYKHQKAIIIFMVSLAVVSWINNLFFNSHFK